MNILKKHLRIAVYLLASFFWLGHSAHAMDHLLLESDHWVFAINPTNLEITATNKQNKSSLKIADGIKNADTVTQLKIKYHNAQWYYPKYAMTVNVTTDKEGLAFHFSTKKEQTFQWPVAGSTPQATALVIPAGEGMYVPNKAPFWLNEFKKHSKIALILPFLSVQYDQQYVNYLTPLNERMEYRVDQAKEQLYITSSHDFLKRDHFPDYTVYIHMTGNAPINPALDYRKWLIENDHFISLKEKMIANPEVKKLLGAFHVWAWGDGKTLPMLQIFKDLGIGQLWLGYDPSPTEKNNITQEYVNTAKGLGYLIAPYDSFDNAQDPTSSDSITSIWENELWPKGCIQNADGSLMVGFAGRGCYLSSEAFQLREATEHNIAKRVTALTTYGNNSYFLDVDATDPLLDDYSTDHPMTTSQDKDNRLKRMEYVSNVRQLVTGSEGGLGWANTAISYTNGSFSTFNEAFWPHLGDKENFGSWYPTEAPQVLFKPYDAPQDFITASYDPRYRLPLYEAALHDAVVSTDRWELNELKIPAILKTKALLESLYNVPAIWVLNIETLKNNAQRFARYHQFFSPIHQVAGVEPLSSFKWLTSDRMVQETQFGNALTITANFYDHAYAGIGAHCVRAVWAKTQKVSVYCPE